MTFWLKFKWRFWSVWPFGNGKPKPDSIPSMEDSALIMNSRIDNVRMEMSRIPPGRIVPLEDPLDQAEKREGLQIKWEVGERIPWKGIWFRVSVVHPSKLELIPETMTFKRAKAVEAARAGQI